MIHDTAIHRLPLFLQRSDTGDVRRFGVLLLALLQLGAAGVQSADAILEAEGASLPTHVESEESEDCGVQHDHLFCQVVRSLSAVAWRGDVPGVIGLHDHRSFRLPGDADVLSSAVDPDGSARPRAPPVA